MSGPSRSPRSGRRSGRPDGRRIGRLRIGAGAVLGAIFFGVVRNALPVIYVSPFWQLAVSGAAILGAVIINTGRERRAGRLILKEASS